jgi:hypothetical protein
MTRCSHQISLILVISETERLRHTYGYIVSRWFRMKQGKELKAILRIDIRVGTHYFHIKAATNCTCGLFLNLFSEETLYSDLHLTTIFSSSLFHPITLFTVLNHSAVRFTVP